MKLTADEKSLDGPSGPEKDFTDLHAWCEVFIPFSWLVLVWIRRQGFLLEKDTFPWRVHPTMKVLL